MKLLGTLVILFILSALTIIISTPAGAQEITCQPVYGGGTSCEQQGNLQLNKKVRSPETGNFVDNLGVNDRRFRPDQEIFFQVQVKNTGSRDATRVMLTDTFPRSVNFVRGAGEFNRTTRVATLTIETIKPNETKTYTYVGKIVAANSLPASNISCAANQANVTQGNNKATDTAQFCIEKVAGTPTTSPARGTVVNPTATPMPQRGTQNTQPTQSTTKGGQTETKGGQTPVYPTPQSTTTPQTGPELLTLIGLLPMAGAGFYLRRKTA